MMQNYPDQKVHLSVNIEYFLSFLSYLSLHLCFHFKCNKFLSIITNPVVLLTLSLPACHYRHWKIWHLYASLLVGSERVNLVRHCGLVGSAPAWDGTGCEFDSWQCRINIPCSLSLRLLGSLRGSLGTYGLTQKLC